MEEKILIGDLMDAGEVLGSEVKGVKTSDKVLNYLKQLEDKDPEKFEEIKASFFEQAKERGWLE